MENNIYQSSLNFDVETIVKWKVSAKWALKVINCTYEGIINNCKGKCYCTPSFWPCNAEGKTVCYYLGKTGCTLSNKDKPVTCLLFPLTVVRNTLVLYWRAPQPHSCCYPNYGKGSLSVVKSIKPCLEELFGVDLVLGIIKSVEQGIDFEFIVPKEVELLLKYEHKLNIEHKRPFPRSELKL